MSFLLKWKTILLKTLWDCRIQTRAFQKHLLLILANFVYRKTFLSGVPCQLRKNQILIIYVRLCFRSKQLQLWKKTLKDVCWGMDGIISCLSLIHSLLIALLNMSPIESVFQVLIQNFQ